MKVKEQLHGVDSNRRLLEFEADFWDEGIAESLKQEELEQTDKRNRKLKRSDKLRWRQHPGGGSRNSGCWAQGAIWSSWSPSCSRLPTPRACYAGAPACKCTHTFAHTQIHTSWIFFLVDTRNHKYFGYFLNCEVFALPKEMAEGWGIN